MSKNIVFVSIFDLTKVFYEISMRLRKRGHEIYWITTSEPWTAWLLAQGEPAERILELVYDESDFISSEEASGVLCDLVKCEKNADVTANQVLMMDRFVLYKNKPNINEFVLLYYRDMKSFLKQNEIDIVFAEPTNTNEVMAHMICQELDIQFLSPAQLRVPTHRFMLCKGFIPSDMVTDGRSEEFSVEDGRAVLNRFMEKQETPAYFKKLAKEKVIQPAKVAQSTFNRIRLLFTSKRNNLTHHDLSERIGNSLKRVVNGFYLRRVQKYSSFDAIEGKIAFYPLHVQPESSIDVQGPFHSNQLKLIRDIRRSLPFDTTLVVKEHPNYLGQRGRLFFDELTRIPNVKLVRHDVSTFDIYRRASVVLTVTGTPALEAGLLGIPAITFVRMYFGGFSSMRFLEDVTILKDVLFELLDNFERDFEADCRFMAELMNKSFEGLWTDPLFDPLVMTEANIEMLATAFTRVVERDSN